MINTYSIEELMQFSLPELAALEADIRAALEQIDPASPEASTLRTTLGIAALVRQRKSCRRPSPP